MVSIAAEPGATRWHEPLRSTEPVVADEQSEQLALAVGALDYESRTGLPDSLTNAELFNPASASAVAPASRTRPGQPGAVTQCSNHPSPRCAPPRRCSTERQNSKEKLVTS